MGERSQACWFFSSREEEGPHPQIRESQLLGVEADSTSFRNQQAALLDLHLEMQAVVAPRGLGDAGLRAWLPVGSELGPRKEMLGPWKEALGSAGLAISAKRAHVSPEDSGTWLSLFWPPSLYPSMSPTLSPLLRLYFPDPIVSFYAHSSLGAPAPSWHLLSVASTHCLLPAPQSFCVDTGLAPASWPYGPRSLPSLSGSLAASTPDGPAPSPSLSGMVSIRVWAQNLTGGCPFPWAEPQTLPPGRNNGCCGSGYDRHLSWTVGALIRSLCRLALGRNVLHVLARETQGN